jgi:hypothetical protein
MELEKRMGIGGVYLEFNPMKKGVFGHPRPVGLGSGSFAGYCAVDALGSNQNSALEPQVPTEIVVLVPNGLGVGELYKFIV